MSTVLEAELLVHLDAQINSARHLLKLVLAQGAAIRERDTEAVLARLADIQNEMVRRGKLETDRTGLLQRAGAALGLPATAVTLERLCQLEFVRVQLHVRPPTETPAPATSKRLEDDCLARSRAFPSRARYSRAACRPDSRKRSE